MIQSVGSSSPSFRVSEKSALWMVRVGVFKFSQIHPAGGGCNVLNGEGPCKLLKQGIK